jgi:acetyl-CoA carboxylase biotin carboxyl carrier protein
MAELDVDYLKRLMEVFSTSPLNSMTLKHGEFEITMQRDPENAQPSLAPVETPNETRTQSASALESPLSGIVYLAPSSDAEPFVTVGQKVSRGETVMLCEAMKTMMPIVATEDGVVDTIAVADGAYVEMGDALLHFLPARA